MWTNRDMIDAIITVFFSVGAVMVIHYLINF